MTDDARDGDPRPTTSPTISTTSRRSATSRRTRCSPTSATSRSSSRFLGRYYGGDGVDVAGRRPARDARIPRRTSRKRGLGKRSMARTLSGVRSFYRYLHRNEIVDANPARAVGAPQAREVSAGLSRPRADRSAVPDGRGARVGGQVRRRAQPRDPRAVLLHRHAPVRAAGAEPRRPRYGDRSR